MATANLAQVNSQINKNAPTAGTAITEEWMDNRIDIQSCHALNADPNTPDDLTFCLKGDTSGMALSSDRSVDQQIIVHVTFLEPVNLSTIQFIASTPPQSTDVAPPRVVKLYYNKIASFEDVEEDEGTCVIQLDQLELGAPVVKNLERAAFRNTQSLSIFIEENQSDQEISFINKIRFRGIAASTTNMNDLKKCKS